MVGAALRCSIRDVNVFNPNDAARRLFAANGAIGATGTLGAFRVERRRRTRTHYIILALHCRSMNSSWVGITRMQLAITPRMFCM